jgi:MOSC domain-containing protein YiiM
MARLLSVNLGLPRDIEWQGKTVHTAVWKTPVQGRRMTRRLNIDGDGQGDLAGHGGEHRAVFVYQIETYRYWQNQLGRNDFTYGQFGENFTVEGLADTEVCIGDHYRIGDALFEVTQPRVTCYRLGIRMNEPQMAALLISHGRPGFYFRVLEEGEVGARRRNRKGQGGSRAGDCRRDQCAVIFDGSSGERARTSVAHLGIERRLASLVRGAARPGTERPRNNG